METILAHSGLRSYGVLPWVSAAAREPAALASDEPAEACARVNNAMQLWGQNAYQFQHYLHLVARMHIKLYIGDAPAAWACVTKEWPRLRSSFLPCLLMACLRFHAALTATI